MHKFSSSFLIFLPAALLLAGMTPSHASSSGPDVAAQPIEAVAAEKLADAGKAPAKDDAAAKDDKSSDAEGANAAADTPAAGAVTAAPIPQILLLPRPRPMAIAGPQTTPDGKLVAAAGDDDDLPVIDTDETIPLPPYPPKARITVGALQTYSMGEEDSLLDVARYFKLGFVELRAANPNVDPWTPVPGEPVTIPSFHLLPRAEQKGIVVNLAQMRLYYFKTPGKEPITYPIGIGREGLLTPTGQTTIVRKVVGPTWFPTPRMREEKPFLPAAVPPGPNNPLGSHALYLGWDEYRIHGTDKPWAIGRRVSSGCMRMYPEDIVALYKMIPVGTKVTVVDQPIMVGWVGDDLYLEANPSKSQNIDIEINGEHEIKGLTDGLKKVITDAAGHDADKIDWGIANQVVEERLGYPIVIANAKGPITAPKPKTKHHSWFQASKDTQYHFNQ